MSDVSIELSDELRRFVSLIYSARYTPPVISFEMCILFLFFYVLTQNLNDFRAIPEVNRNEIDLKIQKWPFLGYLVRFSSCSESFCMSLWCFVALYTRLSMFTVPVRLSYPSLSERIPAVTNSSAAS